MKDLKNKNLVLAAIAREMNFWYDVSLKIVMESMLGYPKEPLCTAIRRGLFLYYNKMICKCYNLCYNIYSEFVHILICTNFLYMGILCKQSAFFHV